MTINSNTFKNSKIPCLAELESQLANLKIKQGIISRNIGKAKSNSDSYNHLLDQMKDLSIQSKAIQKNIKIVKDKSIKSEVDVISNIKLFPPQFNERIFTDSEVNITVNECLDMDKWDDYISTHPNSSAYHISSIKRVIENSFDLRCYYLSAEDVDGVIIGVLPLTELNSKLFGHFFVSLPFFNYGGVLANSLKIENKLLYSASELAKKLNIKHIEYRHCYVKESMPTRSDKISMLLNLPDSKDQLWDNIGSKIRAQIKKPIKAGATVKIGREELVDDFYIVFSRNMRDLGTPVYSKLLFKNMLQANGKANIAVVYLDSKPVSVAFILGWRNTMEIPWASTLRVANKYTTNMLLYWAILKFSISEGYKIFDFGRSSKESNTYRFKKQWGAQEHALYWHYWLPNDQDLPQLNPNNPKYKLLINIWKIIPVKLANIIGPLVVKNLP